MAIKLQDPAGARAIAIAWSLGWPIAAGVLAGAWLDSQMGSDPWAALALGLGAFVGSVRRIIMLTPPDDGR